MSRKALGALQIASAVVPVLTRRMPRKKRLLVWLATTLAVAAATRFAQKSPDLAD